MKRFKNFIKRQFRKKSRVYIMPTSMGWYLIGLILLIFLLGVGYSNNLLLGLGLFLSSLALFWLIEAHFWMDNFKFEGIHLSDAEANTPMLVKLLGTHPQQKFFLEKLKAELEVSENEVLKIEESKETMHTLVSKRGSYQAEFIRLGSEGFLGLFVSWRFFKINETFWVYPSKQYIPTTSYSRDSQSENNITLVRTSGRDYHRQYVPGDDAKRIDWKRLAKNDDLFVFVGEENRGIDEIIIQINKHSPSLEIDLSQASYLISTLFQENRPWSLSINGETEGPECSESFAVKSQRRLAEC
jgi:uncharacterized protein (DUF58 family)